MSNTKLMADALAKLVAMEKANNPKPRDIDLEIEALNIALKYIHNKDKQKEILLKLKTLMEEKKRA